MASGLHPSLLVSDKINYKLWTEDTACSQLLRAPGHLLTQANSVDASTSLAGIKPWYHVCRSRHKASQHTLKQNKPVTPLFHWGQALQHTLKWNKPVTPLFHWGQSLQHALKRNKPVTPLFHWGQSLQHTLKRNKPVTPLFHWGQSLQHTLKSNKPVTLLFWGQSRPWNGTSLWHFCSSEDSHYKRPWNGTSLWHFCSGEDSHYILQGRGQRTTHFTGLPWFSLALKHVQTTNERDRQIRDIFWKPFFCVCHCSCGVFNLTLTDLVTNPCLLNIHLVFQMNNSSRN